ncbi:MAG: iron-containing alcohol dehydrogenase [Candidatus Margulisbacteria bacterium]|nr:iron-containing alcohol dehydrogenase [Candidatus Margulisiibacteriota bacterium]
MIIGKRLVSSSATYFGPGKIMELPVFIKLMGTGVVVHGRSFMKKKQCVDLKKILKSQVHFNLYEGFEPRLRDIRELIEFSKKKKARWIAGIGGGAVMDLAKAAAGLYHANQDPEYYQNGGILERTGIPFIAVPTTAGSGAEATINAVIINERTSEKLSLADESFIADKIILDPELLAGISPTVLAYSGLDAITQSIESYFSRNANWYTETMALKSFTLLISNIEAAYEVVTKGKTANPEIFSNMLLGSYLSGLAFTNSRLGVVHGMAHPLGSYYQAAHGLVCALCLIPALKINQKFVEKKYQDLSRIAGDDLIKKIEVLKQLFKIPEFFKGKEIIKKEQIINYTINSGSTRANPKDITREDVEWLLKQLFEV